MKCNLFAPATVMAVVLALTSYASSIDNAVRDALGYPATVADQSYSDAPSGSVVPSGPQETAPGAPPDEGTMPAAQDTGDSIAPAQADNEAEVQDSAAANPVIQRSETVGKGDTIRDILARGGVNGEDAGALIVALAKVLDMRELKPGQTIRFAFQRQEGAEHLVTLDMDVTPDRSLSVAANDDGSYTANEIRAHLTTVTRAALATVDGSLYEAGAQAGVPPAIMAAFIRAYSYNVDFQRDIQPGDKFAVLYEAEVNDRQQVVRSGSILAAFLKTGGRAQQIYLARADGALQFFSPDGRSIRKMLLRTPVAAVHITSGFGMRVHPLLGYSKMHKGVDFGAPWGTPVYAAGEGVVDRMGWFGGYGRYMRLRHAGNMGTAYAHLSRFNPSLHVGSTVRQGQVIALSGATGAATGPHLHFEVLKNGVQVNPLKVTETAGQELRGRELVAFRSLMEKRDQQLRELIQPKNVANGTTSASSRG